MIAIDTSALIWAVKGSLDNKLTYSAQMDAIKRMGGPIVLPTPALAEYLVRLNAQERSAAMAMVSDTMQIAPFDLRAVMYAADLFKGVKNRNKKKGSRREFKLDAMILAVALANGADTFLYEDGDYEGLSASCNIKLVRASKIEAQTIIPPPQ